VSASLILTPRAHMFSYQREECASAGVHALNFAGIHGTKDLGAFSICLSGGYEDDKDEGDFL